VSLTVVRGAIRDWLRKFDGAGALPVRVACSGGADSLALALAAFHEIERDRLGAVTVDHQLQQGSADQARRTAGQLRAIGYLNVRIATVSVGRYGGPEAAARTARYQGLLPATPDGGSVLLAHTQDDQAETVLLGLGRGSGPRSIAGMDSWRKPWGRPFLAVRRAETEAACQQAGLTFWNDPHNVDSTFTRVALRKKVLPLLEEVLGGGVSAALARTALLMAQDLEALDYLAAQVLAKVLQPGGSLDVELLAAHPAALRTRALRAWSDAMGSPGLTADHLLRLDALVTGKKASGAVRLPGALDAVRTGTTLSTSPTG